MKKFFCCPRSVKAFVIAFVLIMVPVSCKNQFFVSVVRPVGTKVITKDRIKVTLDLSPTSLMMNRITIVNKSADTVSVAYPFKIVLRFFRTGITLPAVSDYRDYIQMRYAAAKKRCSDARYPYNCSDAIEKVFQEQLNVTPFTFGDILPRKKKEGYIAFNLPDPLNPTEQAESIAEAIRSDTTALLDGTIEVNLASRPSKSKKKKRDYQFVFPINIVTSSDESKVLLGILKNY
ncbi:MAG: hypothetical protein JW913_01045 [Chitinispirillaceae bacterium]|nr:hypothetical protein [Chitinispirillaceae bacterium]